METNQPQDLGQMIQNNNTSEGVQYETDFVNNYQDRPARFSSGDDPRSKRGQNSTVDVYTDQESKQKVYDYKLKSLAKKDMSLLERIFVFYPLDLVNLYPDSRFLSRIDSKINKQMKNLKEAEKLLSTATTESREKLEQCLEEKDKADYFIDKYDKQIEDYQKLDEKLTRDYHKLEQQVAKGNTKENSRFKETGRYIMVVRRKLQDTIQARKEDSIEYIKENGATKYIRRNELEKQTLLEAVRNEYDRLEIVKGRLAIETSNGNKKIKIPRIMRILGESESIVESAAKLADEKDNIMDGMVKDLQTINLNRPLPVGKGPATLEGINHNIQCQAYNEVLKLRADEANLI